MTEFRRYITSVCILKVWSCSQWRLCQSLSVSTRQVLQIMTSHYLFLHSIFDPHVDHLTVRQAFEPWVSPVVPSLQVFFQHVVTFSLSLMSLQWSSVGGDVCRSVLQPVDSAVCQEQTVCVRLRRYSEPSSPLCPLFLTGLVMLRAAHFRQNVIPDFLTLFGAVLVNRPAGFSDFCVFWVSLLDSWGLIILPSLGNRDNLAFVLFWGITEVKSNAGSLFCQ